jgi:hypothetical protein
MKNTPKRVLLFAATVVLGACAHVQTEWRSSTGATSSQLQKDAAECQFKARFASLPAILAGRAEPSSVGDLEQMCMNSRGYYQVEKTDASEVNERRPLVAHGESADAWMRLGSPVAPDKAAIKEWTEQSTAILRSQTPMEASHER